MLAQHRRKLEAVELTSISTTATSDLRRYSSASRPDDALRRFSPIPPSITS
jgi:hypothetical protein